jgi:DNA-binding CsgD family transcriptional regulator
VYEAALDSKVWGGFVEALGEVTGTTVVLAIPQPADCQRGELIAPALSREALEAYRQRYFDLDPWSKRARTLPFGSVCTAPDTRRGDSGDDTPFAKEWMEPLGLDSRRFVGAVVDRDGRHGLSLLSFFHRRGAARRSQPGRVLTPGFLSHLRRAVQLHHRGHQLEREREACVDLLECTPLAGILINERGEVWRMNRSAQRLLAERDGLTLGPGGLETSVPAGTQHLHRTIAAAARRSGTVWTGAPLSIERPSGRRALRAIARPLAAVTGSPVPVVLLIANADDDASPPREMLRSFYGLTRAECSLTGQLSKGRSLAEAAERLGITYGTARQRLGQIFAKTNTRRQAELVHLVLTGPEHLAVED